MRFASQELTDEQLEELMKEEIPCDVWMDTRCDRPASYKITAKCSVETHTGFCCDFHRKLLGFANRLGIENRFLHVRFLGCIEHDSPLVIIEMVPI